MEDEEEDAGEFAFFGRGLPTSFDGAELDCVKIHGVGGTAGSGGGARDKEEEEDRGLLILHGNKHWSSEDNGDNANDEE